MPKSKPTKYILCMNTVDIFQTQVLSQLLELIDPPPSFDLIVSNKTSAIFALSKYQTAEKNHSFSDIFPMDSKNVKTIYDNKNQHKNDFFQFTSIYSGKGKKLILKKYFADFKLGTSYETTPVAVPLFNIRQQKTELFTSYDKIHQDISAASLMDASSAIIPYFPAVKLLDQIYIGNIRSPIYYAFTEAQKLFGNQVIFRILNIDFTHFPSYNNHDILSWGMIPWLQNGLLDLLANSATDITMIYKMLQLHNIQHRLLSLSHDFSTLKNNNNNNNNNNNSISDIATTCYRTYQADLTDFFQPHTSRAWSH
jgi:hypothetical protein